jgi:hypothetical protein
MPTNPQLPVHSSKIAFYISAHGFGHASREQAVINILAQSGAHVYVRANAPTKFFPHAADYHPERYDVGMINPDPISVDIPATIAAYQAFLARQADIIAREVAFIRSHGIQLVVVDMPPLGCEVAAAAGVPCVVITHFTWDWVYEHYVAEAPEFAPIIESIRASYAKTTLALQIQIPYPHEFPMFPVVEKIPGIANTTTRSRAEVRAEFGVPADHRVAVLSMGGHEWGQTDIRALAALRGWTFLVMPSSYEQVRGQPQFRVVPTEYPAYHNIIAASDVLVGKAGGSTVAEVIKHHTPMIHTVNSNWRENALLDATLRDHCHSLYLPKADFERASWADALDDFVAQPYIWRATPMNGAEAAAARVLEFAGQLS